MPPMIHRFALMLSLTLAVLLVVSGCVGSGSAAGGGGAAQNVTVKALDTLKFDPSTITVKAGQPVTVTLQNTGQLVHDFKLRNAPVNVSIEATGGKSASATFTINQPGRYEFYCSQPGHEAAGMKGTLVVQ